jgi:peptidoglycan/LPS O-acetylase OafA/YrhL
MNQPLKDKVHFPNLDGLRLVGSLIIIIIHIENLKILAGKEPLAWVKAYLPIGGLDVSLFFVLSGFLIGYLLLKEKQETGTIQIRKYYIRRALRIWPLYYFIILVGFFLLQYLGKKFNLVDLEINSPYKTWGFIFCLLFLPPYGINLHSIGTTWSVRVEEFFYIIEPFVLKKIKNHVKAFLLIIIAVVLLRNGYRILCHALHLPLFFTHLQKTISDYRISCMAIGGIGAYLVVANKQKILKVLYRKDLQWGVYILTLAMVICNIRIPYISFEFYSLLFCCMIVNLATNPDSVIRLDFKWTNYLGKVSYGLYLYGTIMRIFCLAFTEKIYNRPLAGWQMNLVLYFSTIASTILISILSYEFFEKPFLRAKNRFAVIKTTS